MPDHYAVVGHPISHSKSPYIHTAFASQTSQDLVYAAVLAPLDGFKEVALAFNAGGGLGMNVTVPFKEQAFGMSTELTERAKSAGAVNTLKFEADEIVGDNTDGAGLVADLVKNLGFDPAGRRVLLLGAGGAARGVGLPLMERGPDELYIANRTAYKARELSARFDCHGGGFEALPGRQFDLVINATAASLAGDLPPLPDDIFAPGALAYDMMYGRETPFMTFARARGALVADGLGMLVEQAAEAFAFWRGVRPETKSVIAMIRAAQ